MTSGPDPWTSGPRWSMPLETPCRVRWMGGSIHGERPVDLYRMLGFWSVHLYTYRGTLRVGEDVAPIRPGYASVQPPNMECEWRFDERRCEHLCAHFTFPDAKDTRAGVAVPMIQDLGNEFESFRSDMRHAIGAFGTQPRRSECRMWDILWRLAERVKLDPGSGVRTPALGHPAVIEVVRQIEQRLHESLCVEELAESAGISHNHLTRLFREAFMLTVVGYIRSRRVGRARHLLAATTLPIKAVAREVGIPDPHLFNKTIRKALGGPPSAVRARGKR